MFSHENSVGDPLLLPTGAGNMPLSRGKGVLQFNPCLSVSGGEVGFPGPSLATDLVSTLALSQLPSPWDLDLCLYICV